mgnify:CR=1 FL=1
MKPPAHSGIPLRAKTGAGGRAASPLAADGADGVSRPTHFRAVLTNHTVLTKPTNSPQATRAAAPALPPARWRLSIVRQLPDRHDHLRRHLSVLLEVPRLVLAPWLRKSCATTDSAGRFCVKQSACSGEPSPTQSVGGRSVSGCTSSREIPSPDPFRRATANPPLRNPNS